MPGKWRAGPGLSAIRSRQGRRARNRSSECPETLPPQGWPAAARACGAADRHDLARPLSHRQDIGTRATRRCGQRSYCRDRSIYRRRCRRTRLSGNNSAKSVAVPRARARLHLSRLRHLVHAEFASETQGVGAGVLLRALEPLEGISIMQANRGLGRLRDLARGPGKLAAALRIDHRLDGLDLCRKGPLWLGCGNHEPGEIGQSARIGIGRDADRLLRFYLWDSPYVSGPRSLNTWT